MSVLVCDREDSPYEPISYAADLRIEIRDFMKRNFGIKKRSFIALMQYDYDGTYKTYLKVHKRDLDLLTARLSASVRAANSIYPRNMKEYELRRSYQSDAIAICEDIVDELQAIVVYFKKVEKEIPGFRIDINANRQPINAIDKEITLVKNWRQGDNRFQKIFRQG